MRIFDLALTQDQVRRMIYQEIEDNAGNIRGTQIPKDIIDIDTNVTIPWANLAQNSAIILRSRDLRTAAGTLRLSNL